MGSIPYSCIPLSPPSLPPSLPPCSPPSLPPSLTSPLPHLPPSLTHLPPSLTSLPPSPPLPHFSLFVVFPARAPSNTTQLTSEQIELGIEPGENRHAGIQAGYQLALLGSTLIVSILGGLLTGSYIVQTIHAVDIKKQLYDRGTFNHSSYHA